MANNQQKHNGKKTVNLQKYIYIDDDENVWKEGSSSMYRYNHNFLCYIVTTEEVVDKKKGTSTQNSDVNKSNKTANKFVSFVTKRKKVKELESENKLNVASTSNVLYERNCKAQSSSKIPVLNLKKPKSGTEVNISAVIKKEDKVYTSKVKEESPSTSCCSSTEEIFIQKANLEEESTKQFEIANLEEKQIVCYSKVVPTSYINYKTPTLEITISDGLREIINFIAKIQESEKHFCAMLSKYIQDHSFKIDLMDKVNSHAKLHIEAERRAQNLSHDIWHQQIDVSRSKEINLQENLDSLVRQNRKLQEENEILTKKNEKLTSKVVFPMDAAGNPYMHRGSYVVEGLNRANDKLRSKITGMMNQIENMDSEMNKLRSSNQSLEEQIRNFNTQLSQHKEISHRTDTEHKLEITNLYEEIKSNSQLIQNTVDAGDVLLEDLNTLKRQMKSFSCTINWPKFKQRGQNLVDLIHLSRSCINELSRELSNSQHDSLIKEKDIELIKEENFKLNEINTELEAQNDTLLKKLEETKKQEESRTTVLNANKELEEAIEMYKSEIELKSNEVDNITLECVQRSDQLEITSEKVKHLENKDDENKKVINELTQENQFLNMQLQELNNLLFTTGTANIAKELTISQTNLLAAQQKSYQLEAENKCLTDRINQQEIERETLSSYQGNCYVYFEELQKEVQKITSINQNLRQQLEEEKHTISMLQAERKRHLEEKEVLKAIYDKLKAESNKVEVLEGTVTNINKEATRLAKIAEYNKQLGEQLKTEVVERDEEINKLRNNLDKLNEIQDESIKEKVSLCEELTEVCTLKELVDNKLSVEMQRNVLLDEYRIELESKTNEQLNFTERKYIIQNKEFETLSFQYKTLQVGNEHLQLQLELHSEKLTEAEQKTQEINNELDKYKKLFEETDILAKDLQILSETLKSELVDTRSKYEFQIASHEKIVKELQNKLNTDAKELEDMDRTLQYLQNNVQKLQNDLDKSREIEKDQLLIIDKERHGNEILQLQIEQKNKTIEDIEKDKYRELHRIDSLTNAYNKLSSEYENHIKDANYSEKSSQEHLEKTKHIIIERSREIEYLNDKINEKSIQLQNLNITIVNLQEENKYFKNMLVDIESQSQLLSISNENQKKIKEKVIKEKSEHKKTQTKFTAYKKKVAELKKEVKSTLQQVDSQQKLFKKSYEVLEVEYSKQRDVMYNDLLAMHDRVKEISADYIHQKNSRYKYEEAHKAIAEKLLKAVKMLVEEKINKQGAEEKLQEVLNKNGDLLKEQTLMEEKANILKKQIEDLKDQLEKMSIRNKRKKCSNPNLLEVDKLECTTIEDQDSNDLKRLIEQISHSFMALPKQSKSKSSHSATRNKSKVRLESLRISLERSHESSLKLQKEFGALQEKYTVMEFQKCEVVLRLHEAQVQLSIRENMMVELKDTIKKVLGLVLHLKEDKAIDRGSADAILFLMRN